MEMIRDSVESFHAHFPEGIFVASYKPDTEIPNRDSLPDYLQWHSLPGVSGILSGDELWLKWFPQDLLETADLLVSVDADVFCVDEPLGLRKWIEAERRSSICCMQESVSQSWQYGNYASRLRKLPTVNAGFVVSREPAALAKAMMQKYRSYCVWSASLERKWHDEQGALAEYWLEQEAKSQASSLPEPTNKLLCPSANAEVRSLDGLEIVHTPYPDHPKYYELKDQIRSAIRKHASATTRNRDHPER